MDQYVCKPIGVAGYFRLVTARSALFSLITVVAVLSAGCEDASFGAREKGALAGAALGAGLGAIIGNQTGRAGEGVAIGSGFGALAGGLIGQGIDSNDEQVAETQSRLEQQERELAENRRLIDELRARGTDVRVTDRGVVVNLPDVLFEFDSARLTSDADGTIREISQIVRDSGNRRIAVEGHTDSVGTVTYNQRLSEDRARSVAGQLTRNGVERQRIRTKGYGEGDPIASNNTETGRRRNRRVEIIIENN